MQLLTHCRSARSVTVTLTTLDDVVLTTAIDHGLKVALAAQARPPGDPHYVPGDACTWLTLGD